MFTTPKLHFAHYVSSIFKFSNSKPLTSRNVEEHLGNVGLAAEEATHARIKDLSGGQKVKVVLAACTWCCPHLIILDEPTNYLDRDSLGALANAIKEFDGGVILITHNKGKYSKRMERASRNGSTSFDFIISSSFKTCFIVIAVVSISTLFHSFKPVSLSSPPSPLF